MTNRSLPGLAAATTVRTGDELAALQIEIGGAASADQVRDAARQRAVFSYFFRRLLFWGAVLWFQKAIV